MRKIREMLRLRWGLTRTLRETARSCGVGATTVHDVLARATAAGLTWPLPDELDDAALEARLYPPATTPRERARPDFAAIYRELKQRGVTLELLWQEYRQQHPEDGYGYSRFCDLYRGWRAQIDLVMRQEHRAGEKLFVDYVGQSVPYGRDRSNRRATDLSDSLSYGIGHCKNLVSLLIEQKVIVTKTRTTHVQMEVLSLKIPCQNISKNGIHATRDCSCSRFAKLCRGQKRGFTPCRRGSGF